APRSGGTGTPPAGATGSTGARCAGGTDRRAACPARAGGVPRRVNKARGCTGMEIRASTVLPARRTDIELHTADGLTLVGELAVPESRPPVATLICLHPLPTHGGM